MKTATRAVLQSLVEAGGVNKFGMLGRPDEIDPAKAKALLGAMDHYRKQLVELRAKWDAARRPYNKLLQRFQLPELQSPGSQFHNTAKLMDGKPEHVGDLFNSFDKEIETLEAAIAELKKVK